MEENLRKAYQKSTGADTTTEGVASLSHGIVVDKCTNKFMATFNIKGHGSISKIFETRQDAEFWWDSLTSLHNKDRLVQNISALRQAAATRKDTANAVDRILKQNVSMEGAEFPKPFHGCFT